MVPFRCPHPRQTSPVVESRASNYRACALRLGSGRTLRASRVAAGCKPVRPIPPAIFRQVGASMPMLDPVTDCSGNPALLRGNQC